MKETIKKMVHLARLRFPEKELDRFSKKAEHVLEYIEQLKELETVNIEPTAHAVAVVNAFREDAVVPFEGVEKILQNAPKQQDRFFEVPKVIDEN